MIIGVIGPQTSIDLIVNSHFPLPIEFIPLPYILFTEALALVKENEKKCNALLFTGQTPYKYVSSQLHPSIPWEYLPRNILSTMCALVRAGMSYKNVRSISTDGFEETMIQTIYKELHIAHGEIKLLNANFDVSSLNYLQQTLAYHVDNYKNGKADLCLTGLQYIYEKLLEQHIPVIKTNPNFYVLQEKLELLSLKQQVFTSTKNLPAIVAMRLELKQEYDGFYKSELAKIALQAKITESIYAFSQRIGAAVFLDGQCQYYLITNQRTLAAETNNFTSINILSSALTIENVSTLSIGLGLGHTDMEAKIAADSALGRATRADAFSCYLINENNKLSGPLNILAAPQKFQKLSNNLTAISYQTGIGLATLKWIEQVLLQYHITNITPYELAEHCQISLRSINRILQKLEQFGYLAVIGKEPRDSSGRPSRIIKLNLVYHA